MILFVCHHVHRMILSFTRNLECETSLAWRQRVLCADILMRSIDAQLQITSNLFDEIFTFERFQLSVSSSRVDTNTKSPNGERTIQDSFWILSRVYTIFTNGHNVILWSHSHCFVEVYSLPTRGGKSSLPVRFRPAIAGKSAHINR